MAEQARRDKAHLLMVSTLLELNTGLPFALAESDFAGLEPDRYLGVLEARAVRLMPDVDPTMLARIVAQYPLQVGAQHAYQVSPYDGRVLLVEPQTQYAGLLELQLRPYVRQLEARAVPMGAAAPRVAEIARRFGPLAAHYRSMRDERFVQALAQELQPLLA